MKQIFERLLSAVSNKEVVDIITLVGAAEKNKKCIGQMLLIFPDGSIEGFIINQELTCKVVNRIRKVEWKAPAVVEIQEDGIRLFWNRNENRRRAVIAGGGHISLPLTEMLSLLDFETTVIDDRFEYANPARFPKANHIICEKFTRALRAVDIDENTAVVIVTRGHRYDLECLRAVLGSRAYYIGMIGSRRRIRSIISELTEEGVPNEALRSLRAPIGLDIGAQTPGEIALSIAAEITSAFRGGSGCPLSKAGETL